MSASMLEPRPALFAAVVCIRCRGKGHWTAAPWVPCGGCAGQGWTWAR